MTVMYPSPAQALQGPHSASADLPCLRTIIQYLEQFWLHAAHARKGCTMGGRRFPSSTWRRICMTNPSDMHSPENQFWHNSIREALLVQQQPQLFLSGPVQVCICCNRACSAFEIDGARRDACEHELNTGCFSGTSMYWARGEHQTAQGQTPSAICMSSMLFCGMICQPCCVCSGEATSWLHACRCFVVQNHSVAMAISANTLGCASCTATLLCHLYMLSSSGHAAGDHGTKSGNSQADVMSHRWPAPRCD